MRRTILFFSIFFIAQPKLWAGVNLKNGNFYITYTDHSLSSKGGFDISRTYNSKSSWLSGDFGMGWGYEFSTNISIIGDGTLVVNENGLGGKTYFVLNKSNQALLQKCIEYIIQKAILNELIENNPVSIAALKVKLKNNLEYRATLWTKYFNNQSPETPRFAKQTKWVSYLRGLQFVEYTNEMTFRSFDDSKKTFKEFNNWGLLIGKYKNYQEWDYKISYKNNLIHQIQDSKNNMFSFEYNNEKLITKIISPNGESIYLYKNKCLIYSKDSGGNIYSHSYDEHNNMTGIGYADKSFMLIEYYPSNEYVKSIQERNGKKTEYVYAYFFNEDGSINYDHYITYVITKNSYSNKLDSNYYEYEIKIKPNGERYTYKIKTRVNYIITETMYEENERTKEIKRSGKYANFGYNKFGYITYKETNNNIYIVEYDERINKITQHKKIDKKTNDTSFYQYKYNKNGDLVEAKDDEGIVILTYNTDNKIDSMKFDNEVLTFKYNQLGKPIYIQYLGIGEVIVKYNDNGEILKVDSDSGYQISLKITQAFQNLLKRTKPEGLNFNL